MSEEAIADELRDALISARGLKTGNVADGLFAIAEAIEKLSVQVKYLGTGNAGTQMGAIEFLGTAIKAGAESIADAVDRQG